MKKSKKPKKPESHELCLMWEPREMHRGLGGYDGWFTLFVRINGKEDGHRQLYTHKDCIVTALVDPDTTSGRTPISIQTAFDVLRRIMNPEIQREKYSIYLWNRASAGDPPDQTGTYIKKIRGNKTVFYKAKSYEDLELAYHDFEFQTT